MIKIDFLLKYATIRVGLSLQTGGDKCVASQVVKSFSKKYQFRKRGKMNEDGSTLY